MDIEFELHPKTDTTWAERGICHGLTHVFFGPAAERPERRVEREAIAASYCMSCPVMLQCRETARLNREHGFWGCENDEERAAAGYAPRSPSRRAVIQARDNARRVARANGLETAESSEALRLAEVSEAANSAAHGDLRGERELLAR